MTQSQVDSLAVGSLLQLRNSFFTSTMGLVYETGHSSSGPWIEVLWVTEMPRSTGLLFSANLLDDRYVLIEKAKARQ